MHILFVIGKCIVPGEDSVWAVITGDTSGIDDGILQDLGSKHSGYVVIKTLSGSEEVDKAVEMTYAEFNKVCIVVYMVHISRWMWHFEVCNKHSAAHSEKVYIQSFPEPWFHKASV